MKKFNICPLCGIKYTNYPALSRVIRGLDICSDCGTREALIPQTKQGYLDLWSTAVEGDLEDYKKQIEERLNRK